MPKLSSRLLVRLLSRLFAPKSLVKSVAKSLGSDPMHHSRRGSLRASFFLRRRVIFFTTVYLSICPNTYEFFQIFFSKFRKSRWSKNVWDVFANRFVWLFRHFLSAVRSPFAKTYPNFVTFGRLILLKKNRKLKKYLKKFQMYSDKSTNQFWPRKKLHYQFVCY